MENFIEPLIVVAFVIIAAVGAIYGVIAARKRREGLFELAQRFGAAPI